MITQEQLDELAVQNKESQARRDKQDIDHYISLIRPRLPKNHWTTGWTDETIINTALAFVVDHLDEFNGQYE